MVFGPAGKRLPWPTQKLACRSPPGTSSLDAPSLLHPSRSNRRSRRTLRKEAWTYRSAILLSTRVGAADPCLDVVHISGRWRSNPTLSARPRTATRVPTARSPAARHQVYTWFQSTAAARERAHPAFSIGSGGFTSVVRLFACTVRERQFELTNQRPMAHWDGVVVDGDGMQDGAEVPADRGASRYPRAISRFISRPLLTLLGRARQNGSHQM